MMVYVNLVRLGLALGVTMCAHGAAVAATPNDACDRALAQGRHSMTLKSGAHERTLLVYVPSGYDGKRRVPMVMDLHGSESNAAEQFDRGGWEAEAERQGVVAVAPQGLLVAGRGFRWNVPGVTAGGDNPPNDIQFLADVIDHVGERLCIDKRRVYATGYSGGARMVAQFACDRAERVAAVGLVAGLRAGVPIKTAAGAEPDPSSCKPSRPVPVIAFTGLLDKVNPHAGGGAPYWQYGDLAAHKRWGELNGCEVGPESQRVTEKTQRVSYAACAENTQVQLYIAEGGGHAWPGSRALLAAPDILKPVPFDIEATPLMWRFFDAYWLRKPSR